MRPVTCLHTALGLADLERDPKARNPDHNHPIPEIPDEEGCGMTTTKATTATMTSIAPPPTDIAELQE